MADLTSQRNNEPNTSDERNLSDIPIAHQNLQIKTKLVKRTFKHLS